HQPGPFAAPVGDGQNRSLMRHESGQNLVTVLPHSLTDNQARLRWDVLEYFDPLLLAANEAVLQRRVVRVAPPDLPSLGPDCGHDGLLDLLLRGPAVLVCRETQITVGD